MYVMRCIELRLKDIKCTLQISKTQISELTCEDFTKNTVCYFHLRG